MRQSHPAILIIALILLAGCGGKQKPSRTADTAGIVERVGSTVILRTEAPAFEKLSANDRAAAYYLSQAALAGRDIAWDQIYPGQAKACHFLETISVNLEYGVIPSTLEPFWKFLKVIQINNGFYDLSSGRKIPPENFDGRDLTSLMFLGQANSGGALGSLMDVQLMRIFIVDTLFNPARDSVLFARDPISGAWTSLPPGFYDRMSVDQAQEFIGQYPYNSKLTQRSDRLIEQVWRAGDEEVAPGLFADQLRQVIANLEKGRPYIPAQRVAAVDALICCFRTGNQAAFDSAATAWRGDSSPVDFVMGFTDTRLDPLGKKGLWTGLVFIQDPTAQAKLDRWLEATPKIMAEVPGLDREFQLGRRIKAVQLLTATGANGPMCPEVYRDPPYFGEGTLPGQSLIFTNILAARSQARARGIESIFGFDAKDSSQAVQTAAELAFSRAILMEICGAEIESSVGIKANIQHNPLNLLNEVLKQAQIWWMMGDGRIASSGLMRNEASAQVYRSMGRKFLASLGDTLNVPIIRIIGNYLLETGAFKVERVGGRIICKPAEAVIIQDRLAQLVIQLRELVASPAVRIQRDFLVKYNDLGPAEFKRDIYDIQKRSEFFTTEAFILPLVRAKYNSMGGLEEVRLDMPDDFSQEMLFYGGREKVKQK